MRINNKWIVFFVLLFKCVLSDAQTHIICKVIDNETNKSLSNHEITIGNQLYKTNKDGTFELIVQNNNEKYLILSLGYKSVLLSVDSVINKATIDLHFEKEHKTINEITVEGESIKGSTPTQNESIKLKPQQITSLPTVLGESDVLRALSISNGIKQPEGSQGILVRGGSQDQNLLFFDDAIVYNSAHLLGFYSVFNTQAIKEVTLYKSAIPPMYGGRLSSVLDVTGTSGSMIEWKKHLSVGLLAANASISGPIKKDTCSFAVSARRTYIDKLVLPIITKVAKSYSGSQYYFQDYTAKFAWKPSAKDRFELTGYWGNDLFSIANSGNEWHNTIGWGNAVGSLKWKHRFSENTQLSQTIAASNYTFEYDVNQKMYVMNLKTGISTIRSLSVLSIKNSLFSANCGIELQYNSIIPNNVSARIKDFELNMGKNVFLSAVESGQFFEAWRNFDRWKIMLGMRLSEFAHIGPFIEYNSSRIQKDSTAYSTLQSVEYYVRPEPRSLISYAINEKSRCYVSACRTTQYLHYIPIISSALPAEIWLPSTHNLLPQTAWQFSTGYEHKFKNFESSIEAYYKKMDRVTEPKSSTFNLYGNQENYSDMLYTGSGYAWGIETNIQKHVGKLTGTFSYTYSRSLRQFSEINNGSVFPAKYDRPHDITITICYQLSNKITLSTLFTYYSGITMTMPVARYAMQGSIINEYGEKNGYRYPAYHRADVSMKYLLFEHPHAKSQLEISVANVYNHLNPYYSYYGVVGDIGSYKLQVKKYDVYLFPILPSVTWILDF